MHSWTQCTKPLCPDCAVGYPAGQKRAQVIGGVDNPTDTQPSVWRIGSGVFFLTLTAYPQRPSFASKPQTASCIFPQSYFWRLMAEVEEWMDCSWV
jgi:hypothetical protein